jgi:uncharacterized membrane-anchored protein
MLTVTARNAASKLPQITAVYWVIKIAATTLGETGGDLLAQTLKVGYLASTIVFLAIMLVSLMIQVRSRDFRPALYWSVILTTSMAGTTISDFINRTLGLGYPVGASILAALLGVVFVVWKLSGYPVSVTSIATFRGEMLFWAAILVSNTLGTSLGDFLSDSSGLHYSGGAILIAAVLGVLIALHYFSPAPTTLLFWAAFVLTRPLGATVGDFFTKPTAKSGLGLGTIGTTAVLFAALVGLIIWSTLQQNKPARRLEPLT